MACVSLDRNWMMMGRLHSSHCICRRLESLCDGLQMLAWSLAGVVDRATTFRSDGFDGKLFLSASARV
ncbi:hypothetical protein TIFTF001_009049 [Ficus carica]|uniref:Uncharacterized protein n=1 Tax=Ficus carica TaxID=3494 RepID=A0AA87ZTL2_FICCA|nr:hypothetical protein TIFTF001_009049 [Ficus carica]